MFPSTRDAITKEDPSVDSPEKKFGRLSILSRKEERKDPAQHAEPEEAPASPIRSTGSTSADDAPASSERRNNRR